MLTGTKKIHFVGIGGIGMSGIAWLCLKKGHIISGSDIKSSSITDRLISEGARINIGHSAENIRDADIAVYSSAVLPNNPELVEARRRKIPLLKRGEFLAYVAEGKKCIAVTGSHGKTTTSSIISTVLKEVNLTPSGVVGALVPYLNGNAFLGDGEYFVAEADESDGSFLYLKPTYAVVTNIDREHLDYYNDIGQIREAYLKFINNTVDGGTVVCCGDDPNIRRITRSYKGKLLTYGLSKKNDIYATKTKIDTAGSEFKCVYLKKDMGIFKLRIAGEHNILNALAAIGVGLDMGLSPDVVRSAIFQYKGAERRFQIKVNINDILVVDDYAHHPTEIRATLKVARNIDGKRLIAVFQPHRYTRTKFLKREFAQALVEADYLILTDIYPANEKPIYGVSSMNIYNEAVKIKKKDVNYLPKEKILHFLMDFVRPGDLVLFLGAGDIGRLSGEFVALLKQRKEKAVGQPAY